MKEMYSRKQSIPVIDSDVFRADESKSARFAMGVVAVDDKIVNGFEREFVGAAKLRANIYTEKGFISPEDLQEGGFELDRDDERSVHFVVLERVAKSALARVVSNMRLIVKRDNTPLPVENFCPDIFDEGAAAYGSTEVSRLISRHEDPVTQQVLKWPMFIAGVQYVDANNLGPVYGLLESQLTDSLRAQSVPLNPLAEAKYIEEINATKQPIEVDVEGLKEFIEKTGRQGVDIYRQGFSYLEFGAGTELVMNEQEENIA